MRKISKDKVSFLGVFTIFIGTLIHLMESGYRRLQMVWCNGLVSTNRRPGAYLACLASASPIDIYNTNKLHYSLHSLKRL